MGSTTHKEQWMTDIDEFMEQLSPIPAFDVTDLIGRLTELGEQYRAAEKIDPSNGYRASRQIDQAIEHLLKADRGFHMALAQAEQRAEQAHSEQHTTLKTQSRRFPQKSIRPFAGLKTSALPCRRKPTPIGSQARVTVTGLYWRKTSCA